MTRHLLVVLPLHPVRPELGEAQPPRALSLSTFYFLCVLFVLLNYILLVVRAQNERDTSSSFLIWCCVYFLTISFADMWFFFLSSVPYLSSPFSLLFVYFYFIFIFLPFFFG